MWVREKERFCVVSWAKKERRNFLIKLYYVEWRRSWKMLFLHCRHKSPEWNKRQKRFFSDDEHIKQIWMINNKNTILICLNIYEAMNTTKEVFMPNGGVCREFNLKLSVLCWSRASLEIIFLFKHHEAMKVHYYCSNPCANIEGFFLLLFISVVVIFSIWISSGCSLQNLEDELLMVFCYLHSAFYRRKNQQWNMLKIERDKKLKTVQR